ncbi:MAG: selenocysteine-specific translation elongation factor [Sulfuritalea sp.]|nr:selenocysteine-specific translation elongation factor [Sulfuritalea sp.]
MIVGTAGHIDHGKTSLVERLTGIDTDRLPEEKRRGMTIDLGFAHLELPGVGRVGVVDVPGHERFVRNMVAGATGIDLVLLVVAADDGIMPQTLEHLDIVTLLGIPRGVVALNKTDRVDASRVRAVADDIRALLRGTPLADVAIVPVSAHTGAGIEALRAALAQALQAAGARKTAGFFRLPMDRVFTMPGHGTVVTGTVASGAVHKNERLRVLPGGEIVRVRGLQAHKRPTERAAAGSRCALNLAGIEKAALARGMMLVDARLGRTSRTADVVLTLSRHAVVPVQSQQRVHVHAGTAEVLGRWLWLEQHRPEPGVPALAQLRLDAAVPLLYGDRFIVRSGDARHTLGGGIVLDPFAHRRGAGQAERRARLARLARFDAEDALDAWLVPRGATGWLVSELAEQLAETPERLTERLKAHADVLHENPGGMPWVVLTAATDALATRLHGAVREYLAAHPRMTAMPLATLHSSACPRFDARVFKLATARLVARGEVERSGEGLRPRGHDQQFSAAEEKLAEKIEELFAARGATPPKLEAVARILGQPAARIERFLGELERAGRVVKLAAGVYLVRRDFDSWRMCAEHILGGSGRLTLGEFRNAIGVGRELALLALEYFDRQGLTRRAGDARVAANAGH